MMSEGAADVEMEGRGEDRAEEKLREGLPFCPIGAWLQTGAMLRARAMDLLPTDFVEHLAGARREMLLAVRSLVDEALKAEDRRLDAYRRRRRERVSREKGPEKVKLE